MNTLIDHDRQPMNWVGDWAGRRRAMSPRRLAVIDADNDRWLSFADLDERAIQRAFWLRNQHSVGPGDVIALISDNRLEALELFLACGKLGAVLAPVSHRLTTAEASSLLDRLQPVGVFHDAGQAPYVEALRELAPGRPGILLDGTNAPDGSPSEPSRNEAINQPLALADTAMIVHTGGSTGLPKLCRISHRQMVWNAVELLAASPEGLGNRRELVLFPFFHVGGWNTVVPVLYGGGCVVLRARFDPEAALACISRYQVNHFGAVEAMLQAMSRSPTFADTDLTSLTGITTAGGPCAPESMDPFIERGIPVSQAYGLTEAGPSNFARSRDGESLSHLRATHRRVGGGLFHCDFRIVAPGSDHPVAAGQPGELQLRSPHTFEGYVDDETATTERLTDDGWVRTGDLACEVDSHQVEILGRLDNVILSGGENIAAEEVEAALQAHPRVAGALVFGVSDPTWGQRPVAWVTTATESELSTGELSAWLRERLASYKCPAAIRLVDALPLTGAGKLDRRAAQAAHLHNPQETTK